MNKREFVQELKRGGLNVTCVRKTLCNVFGTKGPCSFSVSGLSAGHTLHAQVTRACVQCGDTSTRYANGSARRVATWLREVSTYCLCCED